jgi:hypothetical protein
MFGIDVAIYKYLLIRQFGHKIQKHLVAYNSIGRDKVQHTTQIFLGSTV